MNKKDLCVRVARWVLFLEEFDYKIEHRSGNRMRHADALSRNIVGVMVNKVTIQIEKMQQDDEKIRAILKVLEKQPFDDYFVRNNVLYKIKNGIELIVIPKKMQTGIIKEIHERGHFSATKVEIILCQEYFINNAIKKIKSIINNCIPCILSERKVGKQEGLLNVVDKEDCPLQTYHIDHLGPLSTTRKHYQYVFAIIDAFSKYVWLYPTKSSGSDEVLNIFERQSVIFGNPRRIISDRGSAFISNKFKEYCEVENINHVLITTGVPRGNGQVERLNRILIQTLSKLSINEPDKWYKNLGNVQKFLNSTPQRSIGTTPFKILLGVDMKFASDPELKRIIDEETVNIFMEERCKLREDARLNIAKVQLENKKYYDRKRKVAYIYTKLAILLLSEEVNLVTE